MVKPKRMRSKKRPDIRGIIEPKTPRSPRTPKSSITSKQASKKLTKPPPLPSLEQGEASEDVKFLSDKFLDLWKESLSEF